MHDVAPRVVTYPPRLHKIRKRPAAMRLLLMKYLDVVTIIPIISYLVLHLYII
jgi:hypothetical protein